MARKKQRTVYVTTQPDWKKFRLVTDPDEQEKAFREMDYFVHSEISTKDQVAKFRKWVKDGSGWDKGNIKIILKNPDWRFSSSAKYGYMWDRVGYMPERFVNFYEKRIPEWLEHGGKIMEEVKIKEVIKPKISIQERMLEQITDLCGDWDDVMDSFIESDKIDLKKFDPEKDMKIYQSGVIKPAHAKMIQDQYIPLLAEAQESIDGTCEQLNEAYSFMDKKMKKDYLGFFQKINNACDAIILTGKANRKQRKPRSRSKESIIKKLKFQVADGDLGIASISPTDVVYANELWIYNTKSRKIGVYHAENKDPRQMAREGAGLMVKGTTILGFCTESSMQKTLRKPKEQISNWTGNAKTRFAKSFDEVKTTPTKLNGRINDTTIILQAF